MLLRNQLDAGIVDVPEYGVRGNAGTSSRRSRRNLFYRVPVGPFSGRRAEHDTKQRAHPDFPLRGLSRCGVLWTWPHRQLVEGAWRFTPKCRLAKARPEPDLR